MNIKLMLGELRTLNILLTSTVLLHPYSTLISLFHPSASVLHFYHAFLGKDASLQDVYIKPHLVVSQFVTGVLDTV